MSNEPITIDSLYINKRHTELLKARKLRKRSNKNISKLL